MIYEYEKKDQAVNASADHHCVTPFGVYSIRLGDQLIKGISFQGDGSSLSVSAQSNDEAVSRFLTSFFQGNDPLKEFRVLFFKNHERIASFGNMSKSDGIMELRLDMAGFSPAALAVYSSLMEVRYGTTISYGGLAERAGLKGAARFVGSCMARNRFPVIVPCHRVIKADGSTGHYSPDPTLKKHLLQIESLPDNGADHR